MSRPELSPALVREIAHACPHGPVSPEVFESWLTIHWPAMQTYEKKNRKRQIAAWWARVRPDELEVARTRLQTIADQAEATRLNSLAVKFRSPVRPASQGSPRPDQPEGGRRTSRSVPS